ncbi:MAG TPA: LuxR C-terminal-related transcriptional regulator [Dermatophilaceae bacterium]|nr:LuxR C-terminal-related transcriptional regulator [Dermatophilaceae bacterium]
MAASARLVGPFSAHASALSPLLERYLRRGPAHEAFTAEVSERLAAGSPQHQTGRHARLTPSELKVLHRLRTPMSNAEIAAELFVSVNTVKTHAASVYRKLGVDGRRSAVKQAYEHGLFEPVPAGRSASPVPP